MTKESGSSEKKTESENIYEEIFKEIRDKCALCGKSDRCMLLPEQKKICLGPRKK